MRTGFLPAPRTGSLRHHEGTDISILDERDADYNAVDWILDGATSKDARVKRGLGIGVALTLTTAFGAHSGFFGGKSHPPSYDRLVHCLERYFGDEGYHPVWSFVVAALKLHLDAAGVETPDIEHESMRSCVDTYVDALAELVKTDG